MRYGEWKLRKQAAVDWRDYVLPGVGGALAGLAVDSLVNKYSDWKSKLKSAGIGGGVGLAGRGLYDAWRHAFGDDTPSPEAIAKASKEQQAKYLSQLIEVARQTGMGPEELADFKDPSALAYEVQKRLSQMGEKTRVPIRNVRNLALVSSSKWGEAEGRRLVATLLASQIYSRALMQSRPLQEVAQEFLEQLIKNNTLTYQKRAVELWRDYGEYDGRKFDTEQQVWDYAATAPRALKANRMFEDVVREQLRR